MKQIIQTESVPQAIGPYSQAIKVGNTVYLSGQIALDPQTMTLISEDFVAEIRQVFSNLQALSQAAGGDLSKIVKLTIYLTDLKNFSAVNEVTTQFFHKPYPARATVQVMGLPKGAQVEIDAVMVV